MVSWDAAGNNRPVFTACRCSAAQSRLVRRAGLPLTPAAEFLLDLMRRNAPYPPKSIPRSKLRKHG
jgi:hypothetical protein